MLLLPRLLLKLIWSEPGAAVFVGVETGVVGAVEVVVVGGELVAVVNVVLGIEVGGALAVSVEVGGVDRVVGTEMLVTGDVLGFVGSAAELGVVGNPD